MITHYFPPEIKKQFILTFVDIKTPKILLPVMIHHNKLSGIPSNSLHPVSITQKLNNGGQNPVMML